ncbi:anaphase-promoting complex subunit 7 [Nematostella vectensis]|uniref:anaphase-promoting complex subunit 7 n=1 Tax=Nematostella vectensis TaxID=45351 RepID=UPI002076D673|nr:anaphase-promoting complex subunit 7 [Nematostella vectensis]
MASLENVKALHEAGLHSSAQLLASFLLSINEQASTHDKQDVNNMANKHQLMVYFADSLFKEEHYRRAVHYYTKALQLRKAISKNKTKLSSQSGLAPEVDVKYKAYKCHISLKEPKEALAMLEGITQRQRTPKVNIALAKLYRHQGMERSALSCYKEVLRQCPFALEAATGLLALGVTSTEVTSLMSRNQTASGSTTNEWLASWIKAHTLTVTNKFAKAAQSLKTLETQVLRDNVELLCDIAENFYSAGDMKSSKAVFQRAHSLDPYVIKGMDVYAYLLAQDSNTKELERLSKNLIQVTQNKAEPWVAMAHFCNLTNRKPRAVYFAQKAHTIDSHNVQALILKASLLQALDKYQEALLHFREAVKLSPSNFEAVKGLVECYLSAERFRDAMAIAKNALKTLGTTTRTLTLCASVITHDPSTQEKAKSMLEKALSLDPGHTEAVCLLAEILGHKQEYDKAIELLKKHLINHRTARLHQLLGDFLATTNEYQEALDQYTKSLSLNPGNAKAIEGIQNVEKQNSGADMDSDDEVDPLGSHHPEGLGLDEDDPDGDDSWTSQDLRAPLSF